MAQLYPVTIPSSTKPFWECEINGIKYKYPAGTSQNVPLEVVRLISANEEMTPEEALPKPDSVFQVNSSTKFSEIEEAMVMGKMVYLPSNGGVSLAQKISVAYSQVSITYFNGESLVVRTGALNAKWSNGSEEEVGGNQSAGFTVVLGSTHINDFRELLGDLVHPTPLFIWDDDTDGDVLHPVIKTKAVYDSETGEQQNIYLTFFDSYGNERTASADANGYMKVPQA